MPSRNMACTREDGLKKVGTLGGSRHGDAYQVHLLMLLYERAGLETGYLDFRLATEWKAAEKFDDATLCWKTSANRESETNWLFIQVKFKHRRTIGLLDIFPAEKKLQDSGDFSIFKYLMSFSRIGNNNDVSGQKHFVIYTNAKVDSSVESCFFEVDHRTDNALNLLRTGRRFLKLKAEKEQIEKILHVANHDFNALSDGIVSVFWDNGSELDVSLFEKYRGALNSKVLVVTGSAVRFAPQFVKNKKLNQSELRLRQRIMEQDRNYDMVKAASKQHKQLAEILIAHSKPKCKTENDLPRYIEKSEVEEFLQQLTFAVDQPDYKDLDKAIKIDFQRHSSVTDSCSKKCFAEMMYTKLHQVINSNLDTDQLVFLENDQLQNLIQEVRRLISGPKITMHTDIFQAKMQSLQLEFDQIHLPRSLNFIKQNTAIITSTEQGLLTSLKVYQVLRNRNYRYFSFQDLQPAALEEELCNNLCNTQTDLYLVLKDDNTRFEFCTKLVDKIASNRQVKIILLTHEKDYAEKFFGEHTFQQITDHSEIKQLTIKSQQTLLQKTILFQGAELRLAELSHTAANVPLPIANETFEGLIQDETIQIGPALPKQPVRYYIARTIVCSQLSCSTEDTDSSESDLEETEHHGLGKLSEEEFIAVSDNLVTVLSATPGTGKSTLWTRLAQLAKRKYNSKWILHIKLADCSELLLSLTKAKIAGDDELLAVTFLQDVFNFRSEFERSLLEYYLNYVPKSVYVFFDGFDELPFETVKRAISIFQSLSNTRLFINTRTHQQSDLQEQLSIQLYSLEPIGRNDQIRLLKNLLGFPPSDADYFKPVTNFVNQLADKLHRNPLKIAGLFVGEPLMLNMLAEVFKPTVDTFRLHRNPTVFDSVDLDSVDIIDLFEMFVYNCFQNEYVEKHSLDKNNLHNKKLLDENNILYQGFRKLHNFVGLAKLVSTKKMSLIVHCKQERESFLHQMEHLLDSRIVPKCNNEVPNFIHSSIAEFFAARCLFENFERMTQEHAKKIFIVSEQTRTIKRKSYISTTLDLYHQVLRDHEIARIFFFLWAKHNEKCWDKLDSLLWCMRPFPLLWACEQNFEQLVNRLLQNDSSIATFQNKEKKTALHSAVAHGNPVICGLLIDHQAKVNARNRFGQVPLHVAAWNGHHKVVELLIARGANVEAVDDLRRTPLLIAAYAGYLDVVRVLIDKKCNVNHRNKWNQNALHVAAFRGHTDIVHLLIGQQIQLKVGGAKNWLKFLGRLISSKHFDVVRALVQYETASCTAADNLRTTINWAIEHDHVDVIRTMLKAEAVAGMYPISYSVALLNGSFKVAAAILNERPSLAGLSFPLHATVKAGNYACTKILLDKQAEVNAIDKTGRTPLDWALVEGHTEISFLLLKNAAQMNKISMFEAINSSPDCARLLFEMGNRNDIIRAIDRDARPDRCSYWLAARKGLPKEALAILSIKNDLKIFQNPLHAAATLGAVDLVDYLLENHVNVNAVDEDGISPLDLAIDYGHVEVVETLLKHSAHLGKTELFRAIEKTHHNSSKCVQLLLAYGADPDSTNKNGQSALHRAVFLDHLESAAVLLQNGASIVKDSTGRTPLHLAAKQNAYEITELLVNCKHVKDYINETDEYGSTALHLAALYQRLDVALLLIDAGSDVNARDDLQRTPLHLASVREVGAVAQMLLMRNADPRATDWQGLTFTEYRRRECKRSLEAASRWS
ncbi:uncharacterized protein LOC128737033 [Sabethes cyaneus]|uniref:uncharacterized protein LOC128737033 n=1 Tax=Sabethes cyaneus TaxID=53552 RepID=UPI00237E04ED|nr:uncharacterized protein LOC128737033 [Sabethes cyaneus]